jgi:hypothetical protein
MNIKKIILVLFIALSFQFIPVTANGALGIPCATNVPDKTAEPAKYAEYQKMQQERINEYLTQHKDATQEQAEKAVSMCNFNDIFRLINNVITFFLKDLLLPFVIILISYSGWLFMTSGGNEEKRTKAKKIFKNIVYGIAMILCSWLVVYLLFRAFGYDTRGGRAGLADESLNWGTRSTGAVVLAQNSTSGSTSGAAVNGNLKKSIYRASMVPVLTNLNSAVFNVTITPKAAYKMGIRLSCLSTDSVSQESSAVGESTIFKDGTTAKITLKLLEDTSYSCNLENNDGEIAFADETDAKFKTRPGAGAPDFSVVSSTIKNNEFISISYKNASVLGFDAAFLYCKDSATGNTFLNQSGAIIDRSKGNDLRVLNYNLLPGISSTLDKDTNIDCTLSTFKSDNGLLKEIKNNFKANILSTKDNTQLPSVFRIAEVNNRPNSVVLLFNGSLNINPNMDLVCASNGANHILKTKVSFDPTQVTKINGTTVPKPTDGTINSPISLPVVWNGFGLRPNTNYTCDISGKTYKNIAGYVDQNVVDKKYTFTVNTPDIPLIKNPESKLSYYVSINSPQIVYNRYPLLKSINLNPNSLYISQSTFKQAIPDAVFLPVTNGAVVDNGRMNIACNNILGPAAGTAWTRTVSVSGEVSYIQGLSRIYGGRESGYSGGSGFSIPITKDPKSGFMHSSVYACFAGFTVENVPQIRSFTVGVPLHIDPTEIGPVVLAADSISVTKDYAFFNIVASPRLQNSVNYSCRNVNGSYSDAVYWPPQALGTRMPVSIPVSNTIPGLKPGLLYSCELNGTTFQKEKVNYQFNIQTL